MQMHTHLKYYFAIFLRAHRVTVGQTELIVSDTNDVMLRGDADDYANGKDGGDEIDPSDLSDLQKSAGPLSGGVSDVTGDISRSKY